MAAVYDHYLLDGGECVQATRTLVRLLEDPSEVLAPFPASVPHSE